MNSGFLFNEDLQQGYTLPIYFFVLSTRARAQMDVGRTSKDHNKRQEYEESYKIHCSAQGHLLFLSGGSAASLHLPRSLLWPLQQGRGPEGRGKDLQGPLREDHKVEKTGDYELCFNNHFSVVEEKKVVWELDV